MWWTNEMHRTVQEQRNGMARKQCVIIIGKQITRKYKCFLCVVHWVAVGGTRISMRSVIQRPNRNWCGCYCCCCRQYITQIERQYQFTPFPTLTNVFIVFLIEMKDLLFAFHFFLSLSSPASYCRVLSKDCWRNSHRQSTHGHRSLISRWHRGIFR